MISTMHGPAEEGREGAFPVSGEEVQFAKMTEAEKGNEGGNKGPLAQSCNLRLLVAKKHFANFGDLNLLVLVLRFEIGVSRIISTHISWIEELPSR